MNTHGIAGFDVLGHLPPSDLQVALDVMVDFLEITAGAGALLAGARGRRLAPSQP